MKLMELVKAMELRPLHNLDREGQLSILAIRNQPAVRLNMYTSHLISEDEHARWVDRLAADTSVQFFAVMFRDEIIGGASLYAISAQNQRADWAYYLDETAQGKGFGAALEFRFLDYVFQHTDTLKLNCEVLGFNEAVISLHKKFGFVEEGVRREHIRRAEAVHNAHFLGITKAEWVIRRVELMRRLFK